MKPTARRRLPWVALRRAARHRARRCRGAGFSVPLEDRDQTGLAGTEAGAVRAGGQAAPCTEHTSSRPECNPARRISAPSPDRKCPKAFSCFRDPLWTCCGLSIAYAFYALFQRPARSRARSGSAFRSLGSRLRCPGNGAANRSVHSFPLCSYGGTFRLARQVHLGIVLLVFYPRRRCRGRPCPARSRLRTTGGCAPSQSEAR
jgi:hypothetical protein